ncbi:hypothetical protein GIB67_034011, partial [Kingdonia uniflora]
GLRGKRSTNKTNPNPLFFRKIRHSFREETPNFFHCCVFQRERDRDMKADEEMGRGRRVEFGETDDEDNQAETVGSEEDYESELSLSSRHPSLDYDRDFPPWPQSYRQSMDMYTSFTPPNVGFLAGSSLGIGSSFLTSSLYRRPSTVENDSSLIKPLIPAPSLEKDELPPPTPRRHPSQGFSYPDLPPPTQQCSYAQAVLNGINVLCGVGILTVPYAIKQGGWMSLSILLIFGITSCYTGILLKRCLDSSPGLQTYPDIGQAAFGSAGRLTIAIILYVELYICCVEYITLMSDNLSSLFPDAHLNFSGIHLNSEYLFALTTTLTVLPTVWLRNLSLLSYLSAGGVVASLVVVVCLLWVGVVDKVGFHPSGTALDLSNLPVSLGLYGFCYAGHSVFPNIYSSMKNPSQFPTVLVVSFSLCFFLYTGVAICGFMMFGEAVKSQFTLNMPHEFVASKVAAWTTVVNPLSKYALTITPVALSIEELLPSSQQKSHLVSVLIRTLVVFSTLIVALTIPFFGFVMALIGSFLTMLVALIFPCACYLSILRGKLSSLEVRKLLQYSKSPLRDFPLFLRSFHFMKYWGSKVTDCVLHLYNYHRSGVFRDWNVFGSFQNS